MKELLHKIAFFFKKKAYYVSIVERENKAPYFFFLKANKKAKRCDLENFTRAMWKEKEKENPECKNFYVVEMGKKDFLSLQVEIKKNESLGTELFNALKAQLAEE